MQCVLVVANRLPVTVGETIQRSVGGLVSAVEGAAASRFHVEWIGWPGGTYAEDQSRGIEARLRSEFNCHPVFLSPEEVSGYYNGLSNGCLWPLLHHMQGLMQFDDAQWACYQSVNRKFAQAVADIAKDDDLIAVQDYQLMLVPGMLRELRPNLRIGFFLHVPFPPPETFLRFPRGEALLRGVLGADLVGFHTGSYLWNFKGAVLRELGISTAAPTCRMNTHEVSFGVFPIGINAQRFAEELQSREFQERSAYFRGVWKGKRIVLSVERLDYTKGILRRLRAIDLFLDTCDDITSVVFIFVTVPSREEINQYQDFRDELEHLIGKINGDHATVEHSPIHFIHSAVEFTDLCALYSLADVALVTPVIDGMNLVAKEYVACQVNNPGVLVLSEFAGAAEQLHAATIVNPYDPLAVANSLREALDLDLESRSRRMDAMREHVNQFDAKHWFAAFLEALDDGRTSARAEPAPIPTEAIVGRVASAKHSVFVLDYDGTLREFEALPASAGPTSHVRRVLDRLADAEAEVCLVSGRSREDLAQWFGQYPFTLVAEHGAEVRPSGGDAWRELFHSADTSWKETVTEVLCRYADTTPGSFVEEKKYGLVWHYRRAEPAYASWKAKLLIGELRELTAGQAVRLRRGNRIVEVSPAAINKGAVMESLLPDDAHDFVLCAGDDETDEDLFSWPHPSLVSIKVGPGLTRARYRVADPQALRQVLSRLTDALGVADHSSSMNQ